MNCVSKIKHFNHPQHETTIHVCDACDEPTCQYCEPLCCSESLFATPVTLAALTAYEKKQAEEAVLRAKEEEEELVRDHGWFMVEDPSSSSSSLSILARVRPNFDC